MIGQMKTLLRVKDLKQEQAFRELQKKRAQVAAAEAARAEAEAEVAESARTFASREDAIFGTILGKVVDLGAIDETHGRVGELRSGHTRLEDGRERALHVEARVRSEMEAAGATYRAAVKVRDKYTVITDDLVSAHTAAVDYREEVEIEDMFSRPRRRIA